MPIFTLGMLAGVAALRGLRITHRQRQQLFNNSAGSTPSLIRRRIPCRRPDRKIRHSDEAMGNRITTLAITSTKTTATLR